MLGKIAISILLGTVAVLCKDHNGTFGSGKLVSPHSPCFGRGYCGLLLVLNIKVFSKILRCRKPR